jgi:hypothetical protein
VPEDRPDHPHPQPEPRAVVDDLADAARELRAGWSRRAAEEEAAREALLAADADRDAALQIVAHAHADGRLSTDEHGQRTELVLRARTIGHLDDALAGLGGYRRTPRTSLVRKLVFWAVAVPTAPFVLLGLGLLLFGSDLEDHVWGGILLLLITPGPWALRKWAWPRH